MDNLEQQSFPLTRRISLRRRSTTFVPVVSRANSLLGKQNKSNPYVGWFRHSPPTELESPARNFVTDLFEQEKALYKKASALKSCSLPTSLSLSKHSPHVGWFRHSPPSEVTLTSRAIERETEWLLRYLSHGLVASEKLSQNKLLSHSARKMLVSGRLRGGGQEEDKSLVRTFQESSLEGTLETAKVLYKLAWWFLFPVAYDSDTCRFRGQRVAPWSTPVEDAFVHFLDNWNPNTTPKSECHMQDGLEDRRDDEGDSDDDASTSSELSAVSSLPHDLDIPAINDLSLSVSSLAEAYHAHYAAQEYAHMGFSSNHDDHPNRLDYIITQMDVARMSRNASRHLDVQSILSLPVITYEAKKVEAKTRPKLSESCDSWTIVEESHKSCEEEYARDSPVQEESLDVCVICLEPFMPGDRLRVLPCNHSFHTGCIDRWLSGCQSCSECYTTGCPTCKTQAIMAEAPQDGTVPSWAFAEVGSALYESSTLSVCS